MLSSFSASIKRSSRSLSRRKFALSSSHSKTLYCIHWPKFFSALKIRPRRLSSLTSYEITTNMVPSSTEQKSSTNHKGLVPLQLTLNAFSQNPRLQLETALIGRPVFKDRMLNLGPLALLILQQELLPPFGCQVVYFPQTHSKVICLDDAFVETSQYHGVHHYRPELFHQVKRQRRPTVTVRVQIATVRIKAEDVD